MKLNCTDDKLDRYKHFDPLTKLLDNLNNESFVMTVSAPYGCGKTFFINKWQEYLKQHNYKTMYYNAWEHDTAENPLMSFIASFTELEGLSKLNIKELIESTAKVSYNELLSHPEAVECITTAVTGIPIIGKISKYLTKFVKRSHVIISEAEYNSLFK